MIFSLRRNFIIHYLDFGGTTTHHSTDVAFGHNSFVTLCVLESIHTEGIK